MTRWPRPFEIQEALFAPGHVFRDPNLNACRVEQTRLGLPRGYAGAHGIVYRLFNVGSTAVKVFLRADDRREQHYRLIQERMSRGRPNGLVEFRYEAEGIHLGGQWYPIVVMPWVEGRTLHAWVAQAVAANDAPAIRRVADRWIELVSGLQRAQVAHGNLEPSNIIVRGEEPVLIDYDTMCVPALVGRPATEFGAPAYQHPGRPAKPKMSLDLDHFPAWIILIALRALAADLSLWKMFVAEPQNEGLLFTERDLRHPRESKLWTSLQRSLDPDVSAWARVLLRSLDQPFAAIPRFELSSFNELRAAVRQRDWEWLHAKATSRLIAGLPLPADLAGLVQEAEARIRYRERVSEAIRNQDVRGIRAARYDRWLLDDWPAASNLAAKVTQMVHAADVLDQLHQLLSAHKMRQAVHLWDSSRRLLSGLREAEAIHLTIMGWEERERLLQALAQAAHIDDAEQIVQIWGQLQRLGGHPEDFRYREVAQAARQNLESARGKSVEASSSDEAGRDQPPARRGPTSGRSDRYRFSAFFPEKLGPGDVGELIACVSLESVLADAIMRDVRSRLSLPIGVPIAAGSERPVGVPRDSTIKVTPDVPGLIFDCVLATMSLWEEHQSVVFRFKPVAESVGHVCHGWVHFWLEDLALADVAVRVAIESDDVPEFFREALIGANARPYRSVFPSYSHKDEEIVSRLETYACSFGDEYFRDVHKLRAGQRWCLELMEFIKRADIFQLFWSDNASLSEYVRQEWHEALRERLKRPDPYFLRPVYWTPAPAPIPEELRELHFARIPDWPDAPAPPPPLPKLSL